MKLLRWAVAGASVYAVYRYSIGCKAKGEDVFVSPQKAIAELTAGDGEPPTAPLKSKQGPKPKPARARGRTAKPAGK